MNKMSMELYDFEIVLKWKFLTFILKLNFYQPVIFFFFYNAFQKPFEFK